MYFLQYRQFCSCIVGYDMDLGFGCICFKRGEAKIDFTVCQNYLYIDGFNRKYERAFHLICRSNRVCLATTDLLRMALKV